MASTLQEFPEGSPAPGLQAPGLIVFDCDGVLVDSEPIAAAVLAEGLRSIGIAADEALVYERFLGRSLASLRRIVEEDLRWQLPPGFLDSLRPLLFERFRAELRPVPGIPELLASLRTPCCVASSSSPDRLHLALEVTGLSPFFGPNVLSATMVERGKPAPDLFLHAAARMGVEPARTLVVEDSEAGVQAAHAAGMGVIGFTGGGHALAARLAEKLAAAGAGRIASSAAELAPWLGVSPERLPQNAPERAMAARDPTMAPQPPR